MDALLVNGDELELTPDPPWRWMAGPVKVKLMATPGHRMKAKGEFLIWESEILTAGLQAVGQVYSAPGFDTPGTVLSVVMTVNPGTMSAAVKDMKLPVGTVATTGTFMATVVPAINPSTGAPDPVVVKTGTWAVAGQVQDVATSGQPKAKASDDEQAKGVSGSAAGGNSAGAPEAKHQSHYVAVLFEDVDGNKLAANRVAVSTPDGKREQRTLTAQGATRIGGIRFDEVGGASEAATASVRLLEAVPRPAVVRPGNPWIGLSLVDEDGNAFSSVEVELTDPGGASSAFTTNPKGALRLTNLPQSGSYALGIKGLAEALALMSEHGGAYGVMTSDAAQANPSGHVPTKRLYLLELPDTLFRTDSCVVLPEGQAMGASAEESSKLDTTQPPHSSVHLLALAIRWCEEQPLFKLFIAGHTDSVDTVEFNQELSEQRARVVLALLTGDRAAFTQLVSERHQVSDYKQILRWCTRAVHNIPFTCDPGTIDDIKYTGIEPVRTFQREYTFFKFNLGASNQPDLQEDGDIGPLTWGAIFDVLQYAIASELGEMPRPAAQLRQHLKWLDEERRSLGFSEHHPIEAVGRDHYASHSNRRVELLFFDERDILPDPAASEQDPANSDIYLPGIYTRQPIPRRPAGAKAHCVLRLLLHRPQDSASPFTYELTSTTGYVGTAVVARSRPDETDMVASELTDIPMDSVLTLTSSDGTATTTLFSGMPVNRLLASQPEHKSTGALNHLRGEEELSFVDYPLQEALS